MAVARSFRLSDEGLTEIVTGVCAPVALSTTLIVSWPWVGVTESPASASIAVASLTEFVAVTEVEGPFWLTPSAYCWLTMLMRPEVKVLSCWRYPGMVVWLS